MFLKFIAIHSQCIVPNYSAAYNQEDALHTRQNRIRHKAIHFTEIAFMTPLYEPELMNGIVGKRKTRAVKSIRGIPFMMSGLHLAETHPDFQPLRALTALETR